ncbi:hypothetical protein Tco_0087611 [Tanacetum coccineum]
MLTTNPTHPLVSLSNPTHPCGVEPRSNATLWCCVEGGVGGSGDDVDVVVRVAVKMMVTMVPWWFGGAASSGDDRGGVRVAVAVAVMVVVVWCGCGDDSIDGCHGVAAWC